jgi:hypothetical protein
MGYRLLKSMLATGVVLLFLQFWLGMNLNLFVSLPIRLPSNFFSYSGGDELFAHVFVGVAVFVLAGLILSYGSRLRNIRFSTLSVIGFVFALIAVAAGAAFTLRGHEDIISLGMSMSFLIVFIVFLEEYFLLEKINCRKDFSIG